MVSANVECLNCLSILPKEFAQAYDGKYLCQTCARDDISYQAHRSAKKPMGDMLPPLELFRCHEGSVFTLSSTIDILLKAFKKPKLCVIAAAGFVGTGKSTWLNSIIYSFTQDDASTFPIGKTQETQTEGIWVYPYPLELPGSPDTDIMLIDVEGMAGLKKGKDIEQTLMKLYMAAFLLSSVFTIHTHLRFDSVTLGNLESALLIAENLRNKTGVILPTIFLCLKDSDKPSIKGKTDMTENDFLKYVSDNTTNINSTFFTNKQIQVFCKPEPPKA